MERREVVRYLGAVLTLPFLPRSAERAIELGEELHRRTDVSFRTLDVNQRALVTELAEMIIPETDTPGAKSVKVPEFIDLMLTEWATEDERQKFLAGLDQVDARSIAYAAEKPDASATTAPQRFAELTGAQKAGLVNEFDTVRGDNSAIGITFGRLKALTVYGYFTSKTVQEQILKEPMFFDGYKGNVPFTPAV